MRLIKKSTRSQLEQGEMICYLCGRELACPSLLYKDLTVKVRECRSGYIKYDRLGETITEPIYTIDHKTPRSKGGTNDINNLAICCYECNQKKGNKIGFSNLKVN